MYQVIGADGAPGDPVDLPILKEMAADGRIVPTTMVLDSISEKTLPASEMFVHENLFAADGASASVKPQTPPAESPAPQPAAVATTSPPAPVATVPDAAQTPAPPPVTSVPLNIPQSAYPTVATDAIPDLGARFIGLFIDWLISIPLHVLAFIPLVGIVAAPLLVAYWLSRDAFFGGQSIGKRVAKTRVVRIDGAPFTWTDSALRNITFVPLLAMVIPILGIPIGNGLLGPCQLADLVCVLITQRRIGDQLAKTQVVRAVE